MTFAYDIPADVPIYIDTLFDGDGVRFDRNTESLVNVWISGDEHSIPIEVVFEKFAPLTPGCVFCDSKPAVSMCCSSHDRELCHGCYRRTHFVEVCGAPDAQGRRSCSKCEAEGIDPNARVQR